MELIFAIIYILICVSVAYFIGLEKRIGFGYSFLFSFFLTPIVGIVISLYAQKIKLKKNTDKIFKIIGGLLFYPAITFAVLLMISFYQQSKTIGKKANIPDSIKVKNTFNEGNINKVVYSKGILLAELHSGKFELIDDSLVYKNFTSTTQIDASKTRIGESQNKINNIENEINAEIKEKKKPISKINRYNELIKMHNTEVDNLNTLIKNKKGEYKSHKIETPSWWYFKSYRLTVYFFIILLIFSVIGKFILDIGKRTI